MSNKNEQLKKCNTCTIVLTNDNKVKSKNICKECHRKKCREHYEKNIQPSILVKIEEKSKVIKKCNNCSIPLTDENQVKGRNQCKECRSKQYESYVKEKLSKQYNTFDGTKKCSNCQKVLTLENCTKNRPTCKECYNAKCNDYKKNNHEKVSENHKEYYEANKEKIAKYYKKHYVDNKDTYMENNRNWRKSNREHIRNHENNRNHHNPILRLKKSCRTRIWQALKDHNGKQDRTVKYLDCDIGFLKKWLEYKFTKQMTWDNYGTYWHVDHVIPCSKFDLSYDENISHCFRWTNLQPLTGPENIMKQNRIDNVEVISHYKIVDMFAEENNIDIPDFNYEKYLVNDDDSGECENLLEDYFGSTSSEYTSSDESYDNEIKNEIEI